MQTANPLLSELDRMQREMRRRQEVDPLCLYAPVSTKAAEYHHSKCKTRCLFGANRAGKTETSIVDDIWLLTGEHPYLQYWEPPIHGRIEVPDFKAFEKIHVPKLRRWIRKEFLKNGKFEDSYNGKTNILTLTNGSTMDVVTHKSELTSVEGSALHFCHLDEEPPEDHMTSNQLRLVDYDGLLTLSMTPLMGLTYIYDRFYLPWMSGNDSMGCWHMSIYENLHLSKSAIREVEAQVIDEIDKEIRLYGQFRSRTGVVFKEFRTDVHVIRFAPDDWEHDYPPEDYLHWVGIDPGMGHPCAIIWLAINPVTGDHYFWNESVHPGELPEWHAEQIKRVNGMCGIEHPAYVIDSQVAAMDSRGEKPLKSWNDAGLFPRLATKERVRSLEHLQRLMKIDQHGKSKFHVSSSCTRLIKALSSYQYSSGGDLAKLGDDEIDASRYAAWAARNYAEAKSFSTGVHPHSSGLSGGY